MNSVMDAQSKGMSRRKKDQILITLHCPVLKQTAPASSL
jgi:hypothetical protein